MRTSKRLISLVGLVVTVTAAVGTGSAFAAIQPQPLTRTAWQHAIAAAAAPGRGCFAASYPALAWHATACKTAPNIPLTPGPAARAAALAAPKLVGDGTDYSAKVKGKITQATASFTNVSANITEASGPAGGSGSTPNSFSLQLNSQFLVTPACSGSGNQSKCRGWEQFVYDTDGNSIFMQYWLINYNASCPSGWNSATVGTDNDCFRNGPNATTFSGSALTASSLATVQLVATAANGGNDSTTVTNNGHASKIVNSDTLIHLAQRWTTAEWGVYGDGGGDEAFFGANTTLEAQTALKDTKAGAPSCVKKGFTGETNNLSLTATPALTSNGSPTVASKQTNGAAGTASCATVAG